MRVASEPVLVRVAPGVLENLATKDSEPVVILGFDQQGDGTYEMVLRSVARMPLPEPVAQAFHEAYERLAPEYGYKTREASAVPWEAVPFPNKQLMCAVVRDLLEQGVIRA